MTQETEANRSPDDEYFYEVLLPRVRDHGPTVQAHDAHGIDLAHNVPYAYTVGLSGRKLPEMIVFGVVADLATTLLNSVMTTVAKRLHERGAMVAALHEARIDTTVDASKVKLRVVHDLKTFYHYARYARLFLEEAHLKPVGHLQVLLPDPKGLYPGEPKCAWTHIPVLN